MKTLIIPFFAITLLPWNALCQHNPLAPTTIVTRMTEPQGQAFTQQPAEQKAVINTPGVQCQACKTRVENWLKREYGVASVKADFRRHTVTVVWYTDRTNLENIKYALANLGYDADDVSRDPDAYKRLPISCQHMTQPAASTKK
jgi:periplasmic mercuric ion binding protein